MMTNNQTSRVIKFRIYNRRLNRFVFRIEIGEIKVPPNDGLLGATFDSDEEDKNAFKAEECVIQQFTGLTDSTGKEIYEGDIVSGEISMDHISHKAEVVWSGIMWSAVSKGGNNMMIWLDKDLEVIGNIFENPELCSKN